jgi:hypothetical protein
MISEPRIDERVPTPDPSIQNTIQLITEAHRRRQFHVGMRIKLWNSLSSQLRRGAGHKTHDEGEEADKDRETCKKVAQDAMAILDKATDAWLKKPEQDCEKLMKGFAAKKPAGLVLAKQWWEDALRTKQALKALEPTEKGYEKAMQKHAKELPKHIIEWLESEKCRGFGIMSLASIVAEAGDLATYSNPAKLWKRLGVAVIDGNAQGHPKGFWKDEEGIERGRKPSSEEWIEHGYCKKRRSLLWNVGASLIRALGWYKKCVYDPHKKNDRAKHPAPSPEQIKKELAAGRRPQYTDIHMHRRAQRVMEKRFIRDLWNIWCFGKTSTGWVVTAEAILKGEAVSH